MQCSDSLKSKIKTIGNTPDDGNAKNVEIALSLKHWINFWRTLEMPRINYEINLTLTWSEKYVI